jgi:hypothetical protein
MDRERKRNFSYLPGIAVERLCAFGGRALRREHGVERSRLEHCAKELCVLYKADVVTAKQTLEGVLGAIRLGQEGTKVLFLSVGEKRPRLGSYKELKRRLAREMKERETSAYVKRDGGEDGRGSFEEALYRSQILVAKHHAKTRDH